MAASFRPSRWDRSRFRQDGREERLAGRCYRSGTAAAAGSVDLHRRDRQEPAEPRPGGRDRHPRLQDRQEPHEDRGAGAGGEEVAQAATRFRDRGIDQVRWQRSGRPNIGRRQRQRVRRHQRLQVLRPW